MKKLSNKPKVGDVMPEGHKFGGRIYVGLSKTDGKPLYAASKDSGVMGWKEAMDFAAKEDARLATADELDGNLYQNRNEGALKDSLNETGSVPAGWYWSRTELRVNAGFAWIQRFSDGFCDWYGKSSQGSVRLVWS